MEREGGLDEADIAHQANVLPPRRVTLDLKSGRSSVFMTAPKQQHRKRQSRRLEKAWTTGHLPYEHSVRSKTLPEPLSDQAITNLSDDLKRGPAHAGQSGTDAHNSWPIDKASCKKGIGRRVTISELAATNDEISGALLEPLETHPSSGSGAAAGTRPRSPASSSSASDACSETAELGEEASESSDQESRERSEDDQFCDPEERRHVGVQRRASEQTMVLGLKSLASRQQWRYPEPVKEDSCQRVMLRKKVNGEARRFTEIYARTVDIFDQFMTLDPPVEKRHSIDLAELQDYCSNTDEVTPTASAVETTQSGESADRRPTLQTMHEEATTFGTLSPTSDTVMQASGTSGADSFREEAKALKKQLEDTNQRWLQVLEVLKTAKEDTVIAQQLWVGGPLPKSDLDAPQSPTRRPSDPAERAGSPTNADPVQVVKSMVLMKQRMHSADEQGGRMEEDAFVSKRSSGEASSPRAALSEVVRKAAQISRSLSTASAVRSFVSIVDGSIGTTTIGEALSKEKPSASCPD